MNYQLSETEIDLLLREDVPYGDLTTLLLGIGSRPGRIVFSSREETTLCCSEEAATVLTRCGSRVGTVLPSGTRLPAGTPFLVASGSAEALHAAWKVAVNLLEYASGIASRTSRIVESAKAAHPAISVVTTRKSFPGTKRIAIKAITAGGALPHRLGLSETVLVFKQHTAFLGGLEPFLATVAELRGRAPENKIIVEAETLAEALLVAGSGADIVQLDKMGPADLAGAVTAIRSANPAILVSAAGGINEANAAQYAASGVDILVLSSPYFGRPSDIAVTIEPL